MGSKGKTVFNSTGVLSSVQCKKQTNTRDHDLYFMFNLINLSTEITKGSNINCISKYGQKKK